MVRAGSPWRAQDTFAFITGALYKRSRLPGLSATRQLPVLKPLGVLLEVASHAPSSDAVTDTYRVHRGVLTRSGSADGPLRRPDPAACSALPLTSLVTPRGPSPSLSIASIYDPLQRGTAVLRSTPIDAATWADGRSAQSPCQDAPLSTRRAHSAWAGPAPRASFPLDAFDRQASSPLVRPGTSPPTNARMWQPRFAASPPAQASSDLYDSQSLTLDRRDQHWRPTSAAETLREVPMDTLTPPRARQQPAAEASQTSGGDWPGGATPACQRPRVHTSDASYVQRLEQQVRELERYNADGAKQVRRAFVAGCRLFGCICRRARHRTGFTGATQAGSLLACDCLLSARDQRDAPVAEYVHARADSDATWGPGGCRCP